MCKILACDSCGVSLHYFKLDEQRSSYNHSEAFQTYTRVAECLTSTRKKTKDTCNNAIYAEQGL